MIEQHGLHLFLKSGTIIYNEAGSQSTIDLIFTSHTISLFLITCQIPNNSKYDLDHRPILSVFNPETID